MPNLGNSPGEGREVPLIALLQRWSCQQEGFLGPGEERRVHTAGGPVPWAQAAGSRGGQRKCKQLPPSHPGPWSLRRKTLLPKIAHPKLWPASSKLPTVSLGMNEGGGWL